MPSCRVVVGNTPKKFLDLLRGAVAGATPNFPGLLNPNGCQYLRIEPDTNIVFIGSDSAVVAAQSGANVDIASPTKIFERESANGYNNIRLNFWVNGDNAASACRVTFEYA